MTEIGLNGKIATLLEHFKQEEASKGRTDWQHRRRVAEECDAAVLHLYQLQQTLLCGIMWKIVTIRAIG